MSILLVILAGACYGVQWYVQFRYWLFLPWLEKKPPTEKSARLVSPLHPEWWYIKKSQWNKYRERLKDKGPAFLFATSFLVWITDAFHFFQFLAGIFLVAALGFYQPTPTLAMNLFEGFVALVLFRVGFVLTFTLLMPQIMDPKARKKNLFERLFPKMASRMAILHDSSPALAIIIYIALFFLALWGYTRFDILLDIKTGSDMAGEIVASSLAALAATGGIYTLVRRLRRNKS